MITTVLGFFFVVIFVVEVCLAVYSYTKRDSLLEFIECVLGSIFMALSSYIFFTFSNWEVETWSAVVIYLLMGALVLVNIGKWNRKSSSSSDWTEDDIGT